MVPHLSDTIKTDAHLMYLERERLVQFRSPGERLSWGGGTAFALATFMLVVVAALPAVESIPQVLSTVIIGAIQIASPLS